MSSITTEILNISLQNCCKIKWEYFNAKCKGPLPWQSRSNASETLLEFRAEVSMWGTPVVSGKNIYHVRKKRKHIPGV